MPVILPEDGAWSDTFIHPEHKSTSKIFTLYRPKIYYFEIIDCNGKVTDSFTSGSIPRVTHEIYLTTGTDANEFSYEDMGTMSLYCILGLI